MNSTVLPADLSRIDFNNPENLLESKYTTELNLRVRICPGGTNAPIKAEFHLFSESPPRYLIRSIVWQER